MDRGPDAEKLVTLSYYLNDPDIRRRAEPYDWTADVVVREPIGAALPLLLTAGGQHS